MRQVVCVKRVPGTDTRIKVGADGRTIDAANVQYVLSPYDEIALACAVELREKHGGEITVLTLGPSEAQKEMRTCLAMGADQGVLLTDTTAFRDPSSTAVLLANRLKDLPFDLLWFGNKAADDDGGQVGVRVACLLDLPVVTFVTRIEAAEGKITVHREVDGETQVVEADLPCVLTAQKGLAEPRYPSLKGIMAAKKKPLEEAAAGDAPSHVEIVSLAPPPPRPEGRIVGKGLEAVPELVRILKEEVKVL
jgi:electron transfer flavoprotein beta subunit